jgi:hypothetical protein
MNRSELISYSQPDENAQKQEMLEFLLEREFSRPPPKTLFLLSCGFTKIMRLNIDLLHLCLSKRKENGIYVSVDHPHSYTQMALKRHNIPQDGIIYIDAISKLAVTVGEDSQVRFVTGGLTIPILDDVFSRAFLAEGSQRHFVRLEDIGFLLFDNVNVAMQYAGPEKVKKIMVGLAEQAKKYTNMKVFFILDPKLHPDIHRFLEAACDREIEIKDEWL